MKSILSPFQKIILDELCKEKFITQNFRLAGGTALSEFYLKHRYSEDLDFFTDEKQAIEEVKIKLNPLFKGIGIEAVEYREILSSKIFFLKKGQKETVKTDFNYFPFKRFAPGKTYRGLEIESLLDIAISKLDTIITRKNARDFVDFYFIAKHQATLIAKHQATLIAKHQATLIAKHQATLIQKEHPFDLSMLLQKLEEKMEVSIDPIFLGSCFLRITEIYDYPLMIKAFSKEEMVKYFYSLAKSLKEKIIR